MARPRIVDLVIQQDRALAPKLFAQRRRSHAIRRERLLAIVDPDELGLDTSVRLPPEVILVAQPRQRRLASLSRHELQLRTWRLAFRALVSLRLSDQLKLGILTSYGIHERVDQLGRNTFSEIEAVLRRESRLLEDDETMEAIYIEFAALFVELLWFAPQALDNFFPVLRGRHEDVKSLLGADLDFAALFEEVRPLGMPDPAIVLEPSQVEALEDQALEAPPPMPRPNQRAFNRTLRWAEAARARGNAVVASMLFRRASRQAENLEDKRQVQSTSEAIIDGLVNRLRRALNFDAGLAEEWRQAIIDLFRHSKRGFWGTNKQLLYDLQKVCVDQEREIYTIDFFKWLRSFGRRPIKRPLPNQREVLMSKHLRSAMNRLAKARVSASQRERLSRLLLAATQSAEQQLRNHLRPRIERSLNEQGLQPSNLPERVAADKLTEELLDCIVQRGYLTFGDLRDAVSRSQVKLADLDWHELWQGDAILRADVRMDRLLDGVYRRSEFYLRGLQWLSSLAFGRPPARFIVKYVAVPYGGAWVALYALEHVGHKISQWLNPENTAEVALPTALQAPSDSVAPTLAAGFTIPVGTNELVIPNMYIAVFVVGSILLGLLYHENFRTVVRTVLTTFFRGLHSILVEFPKWVIGLPWTQYFFHTRFAKVLRRYVLTPLIPALVVYFLVSLFTQLNRPLAVATFLVIFGALDVFLNSRFGREMEELVGAWLARAWYQFRVQILRSLFDLIMGVFRRFVEGVERLLYAVDEWLLFKTGETRFSQVLKGTLGAVWAVVAYGVRFCVTLLVEPQINPIKHFPVVTVSHKILVPTILPLAGLLTDPLSGAMAKTVATTIVFLTPGIFGFLVWELKSNWRLYETNRDPRLKPLGVGHHGETVSRLLNPGLHSGTIPKIYGRMRRAERATRPLVRRRILAKCEDRLREHQSSFTHFIERELIGILERSPLWQDRHLSVGSVFMGPNSIRLSLLSSEDPETPLVFLFQGQRDWVTIKVVDRSWLDTLSPDQKEILSFALAGLYQMSGIDIVDDQLRTSLGVRGLVYHLRESDIQIWAGDRRHRPVVYHLRGWGTMRPHPSAVAKQLGLGPMQPRQLLYSENTILWKTWVTFWDHQTEAIAEPEFRRSRELLPA